MGELKPRQSLLLDLFNERWFTLALILVASSGAWLLVTQLKGSRDESGYLEENQRAYLNETSSVALASVSGAKKVASSPSPAVDDRRLLDLNNRGAQVDQRSSVDSFRDPSQEKVDSRQSRNGLVQGAALSFSETDRSAREVILKPTLEGPKVLRSPRDDSVIETAAGDRALQTFVVPSSFESSDESFEKPEANNGDRYKKDSQSENPFRLPETVELPELKVQPKDSRERPTKSAVDREASRTDQSTTAPTDKAQGNLIKKVVTQENSEKKAEEKLGVPPPKEQPQFLRNDSILLKPGGYQWEVGISYAFNTSQLPISQQIEDSSIVANVRQVNRVLQMPIELRLGITEKLQGSISLPVGWTNAEVSVAGNDEFDNNIGIGDLGFSLSRLIRQGDADKATILGIFACTVPTGEASPAATVQDPSSFLGRGYFSCTTGLTAIRNFDPVVLFGGFGYIHNFEGDFGDLGSIDPGEGGFYRLGVGFAVNSRISLSTAFSGGFVGDTTIDGRRLGGTSREPLSLRLAATILNRKGGKDNRRERTFEPSVTFGLNEDSIDSQFGLSWTY